MRIYIAEDHPICVMSLRFAIAEIDPAIHVEQGDTLTAALAAITADRFDLAIVDPGLKDSQGVVTLLAIRNSRPELPVLVISARDTRDAIGGARQAGVRGFLSKAAAMDRMVAAIRAVLAGGEWFEGAVRAPADFRLDRLLSPAQMRVVVEMAAGHSNKEIGYRLNLAEQTIKAHVSAILRALGVTNRQRAMLLLHEGMAA